MPAKKKAPKPKPVKRRPRPVARIVPAAPVAPPEPVADLLARSHASHVVAANLRRLKAFGAQGALIEAAYARKQAHLQDPTHSDPAWLGMMGGVGPTSAQKSHHQLHAELMRFYQDKGAL